MVMLFNWKATALSIVFFIFSICHLYGQVVEFRFDDYCVKKGDRIEVDVKVGNFVNILGFQFTLQWDTSVLKYTGVDNFNGDLPNYSSDNVGILPFLTDNGNIRNAWFNRALEDVTLPDNSVLYTVSFDVIGMVDTMTMIEVCRLNCGLAVELFSADDEFYNWMNVGGKVTTKNIIPVELLYFKGYNEQYKNTLIWETASEINNKGFLIENSKNGKDWHQIGFVEGSGNSLQIRRYMFSDEYPTAFTNYYRLKQIDFDGSFEYSKVVALVSQYRTTITVYPNPVQDILYYQMSDFSEIQQVQLLDIDGQIVKQVHHIDGQLSLQHIESGIYILFIKKPHEEIRKLIVKQ